jgi:signal transduction histidine kinase
MRLAPHIVKLACLVLLLTWFSLRAVNPEAELFDRILAELDRFEMIESGLYRDLFTARAGMLRNYDPLVREVDALRASLERLRQTAAIDTESKAALARLAVSVAKQEELVELFKSDNALLHNSLSYFGRLGARALSPDIDPSISAASAAILHLTLDTSSAAAHDVQLRLDEVDRQAGRFGLHDSVEALLAHGHLLQTLLPSVDSTLIAIHTVSREQGEDALRAMIVQKQVASRESARWFRRLLYGTSLLMVVFLVQLGLRLRSRARAMQRRAALEHLIAQISLRFIDSRPEELDAEIERALADLATHIGCDRVYLVTSCTEKRLHLWQQPGLPLPPGWPDRAFDLAQRINGDSDGIVHVSAVRRLPLGQNRETLEGLGLGGWASVRSLDHRQRMAILGFDAVGRSCRISNVGELALLRMALDTFVHAIERRATDAERRRLEARLRQSRRMERIGTFTSGIAHNFNNILGGILGHSEVMEEYVGSNSKLLANLGGIRRSAERARDLVSQILVFGRRRDMRRKPLSISALIAETAALLRVSLPHHIELVIRQSPAATIVLGENAQLQQVILNLCNNAAHALADGGRIEVSTEQREISNTTSLTHDEIRPGLYVCIAVTDNGHGIEEPMLDRLFEPFFTTKSSGNGLGLATVREIVHDHAGGVSVQSRPGEGSRFEVWLPRVAASSSEPRADMTSAGKGEVVMVVGGNGARILKDEELLAALGYEAVGFATADAALAACKAEPDRFDIVVVGQLGSPARSLEFATALHAVMPRLPKVLAINTAFEVNADALLAAGISDVIRWPISAQETAVALAHAIAIGDTRAQRRHQPAPALSPT